MKKLLIFAVLMLTVFAGVTVQAQDFEREISDRKNQIEETQAKMKKHVCYNNFLSRDCIKVRAEYDSMEKKIVTLESEIETLNKQKFEAYQNSPQGQLNYFFELTKSWLYLIFVFALFGIVFFAAAKFVIWYNRIGMPRGDEYGTARPATIEELTKAEILKPTDYEIAPGELTLGSYGDHLAILPKDRVARHTQYIGPTGSGKTYKFLARNIVESHPDDSLFITDVKAKKGTDVGELWIMTSGYRKNPVYLAPMQPAQNMLKFNWIPKVKDNPKNAVLFARAVVGNGSGNSSHWLESAVSLLAAIWLHTATTDVPNPVMAYRTLMQDVDTLKYILEKSPSVDARLSARQYLDAPEKEAGSILSTTRNACSFMFLREIQEFCWTETGTSFQILRETPCSIYYQMRESDADLLKPLNALIFTYIMSELKTSDGLNIKMLLDEFANFGKLPNFENDITLLRSKDISATICTQSYRSQIEGIYGKTESETIINNFNTQIALAGLEYGTAKEISNQLGTSTVVINSKSAPVANPFGGTISTSAHARPLLTPDEVSTMEKGDILVFRCAELRPFMVQELFYDFPEAPAEFVEIERITPPEEMSKPIIIPKKLKEPPPNDPPPQYPFE
jgi:type IV secretion system protein VirD4